MANLLILQFVTTHKNCIRPRPFRTRRLYMLAYWTCLDTRQPGSVLKKLDTRQLEIFYYRLFIIFYYRLFIILHTNRVDSADAEKDYRKSTVRISDCRASSIILKAVSVSRDCKENALCKHEKFMH